MGSKHRRATLSDVLITSALGRRTDRGADYHAENEAIHAIIQAALTPDHLLERAVEVTRRVCRADSAGISVLEGEPDNQMLRWHEVQGPLSSLVGRAFHPVDSVPCGLVIRGEDPLLFHQPDRHFSELVGVEPPLVELLEAPLSFAPGRRGTLWVALHSEGQSFDAEDARILSSIARTCSILSDLLPSSEHQALEASFHSAELQFQWSQEDFQALVQTSSDALYWMSPDWSEMYELQGGTFLKDSPSPKRNWLQEYIHPDDRAEVMAAIQKAIEERKPFELEHRVRQLDGSLGWVFSRAVPVLGDDGEILYWFGAGSDLTARRLAEERLRESEQQLGRRVAEATSELQQLSRRLIKAQESERRHLAHELHDEIGQSLTGLAMTLAMARRESGGRYIEQAESMTRDLLEQVRALTLELRPAALDQFGLIPALLSLVETMSSRTGVKIDLYHEGEERRFSPDIESVAYRIVQEALTNAVRHSGASCATVRVIHNDHLTVSISDDGRGFDVEMARAAAGRSGLAGMRERASLVEGALSIDSRLGEGTRITLEVLGDNTTSRQKDRTDAAHRAD